jgi:acetyl-CoA C-acetyltransferase
MRQVVIIASGRSAGGKFGGSLKSMTAPQFGGQVIQTVIARSGISPDLIDQSIFGNAWQAGVGPNPARLAAVAGGVPFDAPAVTINARCGSSMLALIMAAQAIKAGDVDTVLAGGTESTSNVPYQLGRARWGQRMGNGVLEDLLYKDGFFCPTAGGLMGELTDAYAKELGITRLEQDAYAAVSQNRAEAAVAEGRFTAEIVPIEVPGGRKGPPSLFKDEEIYRKGVTPDSLARLPAVFSKDGTITAGNACALCDAAAAQILMEREKARALGLSPMALIRGYAFVGYDPKTFGLSPVKAMPAALKMAGLSLKDMDLIELNEAFAAQYIACERQLGIDREKANVNGGAIALGHPVGATGSKILTTLLYALMQRNLQFGIIGACIGGGNGVAFVVERLS